MGYWYLLSLLEIFGEESMDSHITSTSETQT